MSEQIKELAKQAYEDVIRNTPSFLVTKELYEQKFAKLIIRKCRDIVSDTRDQAIEDEWNVDEAMSTAMFNIEEHFGL